jgi:hypothetical protein
MTRRRFFQAFAAAMVAVCLLALPGALWAQGNRDSAFERVLEVQQRHTDQMMAVQGVVGTAVGLDERGRHALLVLLEEPGIGPFPRQLDGVPVRPVVTGRIYALSKPTKPGKPTPPPVTIDRTARFERPVPIGVSTGHPFITAGTIGCRLAGSGGDVYALSNNHVYANMNDAPLGDNVLQPGMYDIINHELTPSQCIIGNLYRYVPIAFYDPRDEPAEEDIPLNWVDAAIALTDADSVGNATPDDGYGMPKSGTAAATFNMPVKKYGRTTGLTSGKVYALHVTIDVVYDVDAYGNATLVARFADQIIITPGGFSAGGDSGSLIVANGTGRNKAIDRAPVGLLFAGSSQFTIANPIDAVLDALSVLADDDLSIDGQ